MLFSKNIMSLEPGKTTHLIFDGESQKAYWPKYKRFCVLDNTLDYKEYKGNYICFIRKRYNKKDQSFYIAIPIIQIPTINQILYDEKKKYPYSEFKKKVYEILISDMGFECSTLFFRVMDILSSGVFDEFDKEKYRIFYYNSQRIWKPNSNPDVISQYYQMIHSNQMIPYFFRVFYSWLENKDYAKLRKFFDLLVNYQSIDNIPFWIIPDNDPEYKSFMLIPNMETSSVYNGTAVFTNMEFKRINIDEYLLENGKYCLNYKINGDPKKKAVNVTIDKLYKDTEINRSLNSFILLKDMPGDCKKDWLLTLQNNPFIGNPKKLIIN